LSSLTAIFGNSAEKEQDSEKLMDLYWSRAELKKEFAGMRKEQFRLQDKIKKQEGQTVRVQQQLDHLEGLLADPQWAHNVVVHFQLRGLSGRCQGKLAKFAEQLKQQREQKQHESVLGDWNNGLAAEVNQVQQQILDKQEQTHQLEDRLQAERRRLSSMSAMSRFFRGRSITRTLDELAEQVETAQHEEILLGEEVDAIRNRQPPDTQGLNMPTKRSINLMIMAFVQQMYTHFDGEDLAELIREAGEKSVGAINYGDNRDCLQLLKRMQSATDKMEQNAEFANILQQRAKLIGENASYQQDTDAVPVATSVAILFKIDSNGVVRESDLDMLGSNLWGISQILTR
jgi:hypothetical protein